MSRVVPMQYKYISFEGTNGKPARFIPVKKGVCGGVVLLMDQTPAEPIEYVIDVPVPVVPPPSAEGPVEPVAPAPFDYVED